jgi:glycosyltransferase involved in cell wall biosynthesis
MGEISNPLVSVIMPAFNAAEYISSSVYSVFAQTLKDWELIIIDDCSVDDTLAVVSALAQEDQRVKYVAMPVNSGAAVSRNKGIELAKGRFIAFLDADDLWLSDKLEKHIDFMRANDVAFSYAAYEKIDEAGNPCGVVGVPKRVSYTALLKVCSIGCLTAIYDTEKLGKNYMPLIRKRQDLGLWLCLLKKIPYAYATPGVLAQYRLRRGSISANKISAAQYTWKLYREVECLSIGNAIYYFSCYALNGVLRSRLPWFARMIGVLK